MSKLTVYASPTQRLPHSATHLIYIHSTGSKTSYYDEYLRYSIPEADLITLKLKQNIKYTRSLKDLLHKIEHNNNIDTQDTVNVIHSVKLYKEYLTC